MAIHGQNFQTRLGASGFRPQRLDRHVAGADNGAARHQFKGSWALLPQLHWDLMMLGLLLFICISAPYTICFAVEYEQVSHSPLLW